MQVFAETNFILEIVFQQDRHIYCEKILEFASQKKIELFIPEISISEAYTTLYRRHREFNEILHNHAMIMRRMPQITKSFPSFGDTSQKNPISEIHPLYLQHTTQTLKDTVETILKHGNIISINTNTIQELHNLQDSDGVKISFPDMMILACVYEKIQHNTETSIFVNGNTKDFNEAIRLLLNKRACKLFGFEDGVRFLSS